MQSDDNAEGSDDSSKSLLADKGGVLHEPLIVTSPAGIPTLLGGLSVAFPNACDAALLEDSGLCLMEFFKSNANIFSPSGRSLELSITQSEHMPPDHTLFRVKQTVDDVPILGTDAVVHLRDDGTITWFHGRFASVPFKLALPDPAVDAEFLESLTAPLLEDHSWKMLPELVYYADRLGASKEGDSLQLAWRVITVAPDGEAHHTLVSAENGELIESTTLSRSAMARTVSDAEGVEMLPGVLRYSDSPYYCDNCIESAVRNARSHMQALYAFWASRFGWTSWDGMDSTMDVTIRYGSGPGRYPFWNGYPNDQDAPPSPHTPRAVFNAGNVTADFVVHEFSHAMNQSTAALDHSRHSGALDEHLADCLAALVSNDWTLFEGSAWSSEHLGTRNVANPQLSVLAWDSCEGCVFSGQPDRWTRFGTNSKDSRLVHFNAGIGNKICYLLTDGNINAPFNGVGVAGQGRDRAAEVFHNVLRFFLTTGSTYEDYVPALSAAALKVDIDHGLTGFPTTVATLDALAAVGLWAPPNTVPTSVRALGRVAVTDHSTPYSDQALLTAFRERTSNTLRFAEYNRAYGWLTPYNPGEARTLLGAPDFISERGSQSGDELAYPVDYGGGIKMVVLATVTNGLILTTTPVMWHLRPEEPVTGARLGALSYVFQRDTLNNMLWTNSAGESGYVTRVGANLRSYLPPDVVESLGRIWLVYSPTVSGTCLTSATLGEIAAGAWATPYCLAPVDAFSARMEPLFPLWVHAGPTLMQWDAQGTPPYVDPSKIRLVVSSIVDELNYPQYTLAQVSVVEDGLGHVVLQERNVMQPIEGGILAGKGAHVDGRLHQVVTNQDGVLLHRVKRGY